MTFQPPEGDLKHSETEKRVEDYKYETLENAKGKRKIRNWFNNLME